jgi:hypothetical protein
MSEIIHRAATRLEDELNIGFLRDTAPAARTMVRLNVTTLFTRLVEIYTQLFEGYYKDFKQAISGYCHEQSANTNATAAARAYISAFIYDLYVVNQNSYRKLRFPNEFSRYNTTETFISDRYDPFLSILLAAIRPTQIHGACEETIYIPDFGHVYFDDEAAEVNPFQITNFSFNPLLVQAILNAMDQKQNKWSTIPISEHTFGRPSWLFDHHQPTAVYAWFPAEGNYTMSDVVIPYILGIVLIAPIGPRDVDDWQMFPNNTRPATTAGLTPRTPRVTPRRWTGSSEYRGYEIRSIEEVLIPTKAQALETAREVVHAAGAADPATASAEGKVTNPLVLYIN